MNLDDVKLFYEYNYWANQRILSMAEQVSPDELVKPNSFGWGSLHGTLVNTMDAEYRWRTLCQDKKRFFESMVFDETPDIAAIRTRWAAEEKAMWAYLDRLSDDSLQGLV